MARLRVFTEGQRLRARVFLRVATLIGRHQPDWIIHLALYRPDFFGEPFFDFGGDILRGPSFWTPAEREFLAAFSSRLNECPFCVSIHSEVLRFESKGTLTLDSPEDARAELRAVLPLLTALNDGSGRPVADQVAAARSAGVPDTAIADALQVNLLFNCVNRIVNAMGFEWNSPSQLRFGAKVIHWTSYRLPAPLLC